MKQCAPHCKNDITAAAVRSFYFNIACSYRTMNLHAMMTAHRIVVFLLLICGAHTAWAQKKPLDHGVYDGWETISSSAISDDGRYIYYIVSPQAGDGRLMVTTPDNQQIGHIDRASGATFSSDGKYLFALIEPHYEETRAAKIKKKKADEMPKDSLAIFILETSTLQKIPFVKSYKTPEEPTGYIAYITERSAAPKDTTNADSADVRKPAHKKADPILHIRHLTNGADTTIDRVEAYEFSTDGNALVYVRKAEEKDSIGADAGLYYYDFASKQSRHISRGTGRYKNITFDDVSAQLAFTADKSPEKSLRKAFDLYYYTPGQDSAI